MYLLLLLFIKPSSVLGVKKEQPDGSFEGEDEEKTESSSEEDEVDSGDGWIEDEEPQDEMESADEHPTGNNACLSRPFEPLWH